MLPDRVSNPGPLTYESGALPIALRGPAKAAANTEYIKLFLYWDICRSEPTVQALRRRLIRVYTVFYPILFFWLYYCNVKLNYSIFSEIMVIILDVLSFEILL